MRSPLPWEKLLSASKEGLAREARLESIRAFSILARVLSSLVDHLVLPYNHTEDVTLYSLWHSL